MYPNINMENTSQKNMVDSCHFLSIPHEVAQNLPFFSSSLWIFSRTDPGGRVAETVRTKRPVWTKPLAPLTERLCNAESSGKDGLVWLDMAWLVVVHGGRR